MRKLKFFNVFVGMCIMCLSVFTASCSSDSNDDENNGNAEDEYSIVGTWRHDFSSGYCEITFKKDGTGYGEENDEGNGYAPEHFSYTFEYTYRNDKVTIIYDDDDEIETGQIIWVNKDKFIAVNEDGENEAWTRQTEEEYSIVGTWRYNFRSGYCEMTLKKNGTGYEVEYDEEDEDSEDYGEYQTFKYTYRNDKLTIIYDDDDDSETTRIIWVNKNKFIADIADENSTWVRQ